jgi:branched-subunit amino acid aminotransferase/4-amino-4-deoxychorismate lyase
MTYNLDFFKNISTFITEFMTHFKTVGVYNSEENKFDTKTIRNYKKLFYFGELGLNDFGSGVFTTIRTVNGRQVLNLDDHVERIIDNSKSAGLIPSTLEQENLEESLKKDLYNQIREIVGSNSNYLPGDELAISVYILGGKSDSKGGIDPDSTRILIDVEKLKIFSPELYSKGATLILNEYARPDPEIKSLDQSQRHRVFTQYGGTHDFHEVLYIKDGNVLEGSQSNFFLIKDNKIYTALNGVLSGVTRKMVIEFANNLGYEVSNEEVKLENLEGAGGAFITSTARGIMPVTKILDLENGGETIIKGSLDHEYIFGLQGKFIEYIAEFLMINLMINLMIKCLIL